VSLACRAVLQQRGGSRQLPAKYAAMLPLAAADPFRPNKDAAARMLRCWVAEQRALVAASMAAAARGSRAGGSTMQEQPEMMVPYCLYILAHHPDFPQARARVCRLSAAGRRLPLWLAHDRRLQHAPQRAAPAPLFALQGEDADEPAAYEPFQFMLQFMLQPLLVACGSSPAGATIGLLLKMWRWMKNTADTSVRVWRAACWGACARSQAQTHSTLAHRRPASHQHSAHHIPWLLLLQDPPATTQLYCLCDMAAATTRALAADMQLPQAADYPGGVVLPRSLLRPLDKSERGEWQGPIRAPAAALPCTST
jgi:hypothetical protein